RTDAHETRFQVLALATTSSRTTVTGTPDGAPATRNVTTSSAHAIRASSSNSGRSAAVRNDCASTLDAASAEAKRVGRRGRTAAEFTAAGVVPTGVYRNSDERSVRSSAARRSLIFSRFSTPNEVDRFLTRSCRGLF